MNILQITPEFPPRCGGIGYYVFYLSKELTRRGHKVQVLIRGKENCHYLFENISVKEIDVIGHPPFNLNIFKKKIETILNDMAPNIIHIHSTSMPVINYGCPIVVTSHWCMKAGVPIFYRPIKDLEAFYKNIFLPFYDYNTRRVVKNCDKLTAVSGSIKEEFIKYYKKEADVIYNAVDTERFVFKDLPKEDCLLFVGALRRGKGIFDLLDVAESLRKSHPNVTIKIAGNGAQKNEVKEEIRERKLTSVKMLGALSHDQLVSYYNRSKVFVLPTYYEGLPTTILEAMSCQLPVVASNVSGIPDVINEGVDGYMVSPGNIQGYYDRIVELLKDSEKQRLFGAAGRKKVLENFTWPRIAKGIVKIYEELLEEKKSSKK